MVAMAINPTKRSRMCSTPEVWLNMPFPGRRHKFGEWRQWAASGNSAVRPFKTLNLENGEPISGKSAYDRGWVWVQRVVATL